MMDILRDVATSETRRQESLLATFFPSEPHPRPSDFEIYIGSMLQLGYGYPMWHPDPDRNLPEEHRRRGVSSGDVGVITHRGSFDVLFNIFHSIPDPLNPRNLPEDFTLLPLSKYGMSCQELFNSDGYLSSMDVDLEKNTTNGDISYSCKSGDRGALLSLPHGALQEDLENEQDLKDYIAKNASNWYKYALREGLDLNRHSLYLVTGRMKTNSWGIATFDQVVPERNRVMVIGKSDRLRLSYEPFFNWKKSGGASFTNAGPFPAQDISNQSLFIRGFKISLSEEAWNNVYYSEGRIITNENVIISDFPPKQTLVHPLDIINEALLSQIPVARVAITHDNLWIEGCKEMNYDIEQIMKAIPDKYLVCYLKDTKTCTLEPRIDNSSLYLRATDI